MNTLKLLGALAIICLIGTAARADEKDTAKKLVGKWEVTKADEGTLPAGATVEFTKDGKYYFGAPGGGRTEGTYKVNGDELTITTVKDGNKDTSKRTIKKIDDTDLELNFSGKVVPYKKIK